MSRTITPEVADVIRRSDIQADRVVLPEGQLERKLYQDVNKVLTYFGGKWHKGQRAHLFASDPREKLAAALESGKSVNEQQATGSFYTPLHVIEQMISHARLESGMTVLEPSAGDGRIAFRCRDLGCKVTACELDQQKWAAFFESGIQFIGCDFLALPKLQDDFDRVLMNPPFAKGQDIAHVSHAFKFLKTSGILVAIMASGWTFRGDKKSNAFREFVDETGTWYELPPGTFKESGTGVNTVMVVLRKLPSGELK